MTKKKGVNFNTQRNFRCRPPEAVTRFFWAERSACDFSG